MARAAATNGSLAHIELERTIVDVRGGRIRRRGLRIVYSLTDRSGELHLAATVANGYEMPGYDAGETQICDYVLVNGQNVDFDQAWEVPGDAPGQMLYYLQTNLSAWRAELADAKTLDIRLPMLQNGEQVAFSIPAAVPAGMIRHASVAKDAGGSRQRGCCNQFLADQRLYRAAAGRGGQRRPISAGLPTTTRCMARTEAN